MKRGPSAASFDFSDAGSSYSLQDEVKRQAGGQAGGADDGEEDKPVAAVSTAQLKKRGRPASSSRPAAHDVSEQMCRNCPDQCAKGSVRCWVHKRAFDCLTQMCCGPKSDHKSADAEAFKLTFGGSDGTEGVIAAENLVFEDFLEQHPDGTCPKGKARGLGFKLGNVLNLEGFRKQEEKGSKDRMWDFQIFCKQLGKMRGWDVTKRRAEWAKLKINPDLEQDEQGPEESRSRVQVPSHLIGEDYKATRDISFKEHTLQLAAKAKKLTDDECEKIRADLGKGFGELGSASVFSRSSTAALSSSSILADPSSGSDAMAILRVAAQKVQDELQVAGQPAVKKTVAAAPPSSPAKDLTQGDQSPQRPATTGGKDNVAAAPASFVNTQKRLWLKSMGASETKAKAALIDVQAALDHTDAAEQMLDQSHLSHKLDYSDFKKSLKERWQLLGLWLGGEAQINEKQEVIIQQINDKSAVVGGGQAEGESAESPPDQPAPTKTNRLQTSLNAVVFCPVESKEMLSLEELNTKVASIGSGVMTERRALESMLQELTDQFVLVKQLAKGLTIATRDLNKVVNDDKRDHKNSVEGKSKESKAADEQNIKRRKMVPPFAKDPGSFKVQLSPTYPSLQPLDAFPSGPTKPNNFWEEPHLFPGGEDFLKFIKPEEEGDDFKDCQVVRDNLHSWMQSFPLSAEAREKGKVVAPVIAHMDSPPS